VEKRKNITIIIGIITIPLSIISSFIVHLLFKNKAMEISKINIISIIKAFEDERYCYLYLCFQVLFILSLIFVYLQSKKVFSSEEEKITDKIKTPKKMGEGQYGTARWLGKGFKKLFKENILRLDVPIEQQAFKSGGLVVGYEKVGKNVEKIYTVDSNVHSLTVGATRSGKTRTIVLQTIGSLGLAKESMIISDPKGELYQYTAPFLEKLGYKVRVIDFKDPTKSDSYNYLQPVIDAVNNGDYRKAEEMTWDITQALVGNEDSKTERIWRDGEMSIIAGSIMTVVYENIDSPQYQNLSNVYSFIAEMCKTVDGEMPINSYISSLPETHPASRIFSVACIAPEKTRGSFFTSALTTLKLFTSNSIYNMTCKSDIDIRKTGFEPTAIFIILPDERPTYYTLASLLVNQQYVSLVEEADKRGGELKVRTNFVLDEFGNFTAIPGFANMLTVGGGRKIRFNIFLQSFSQLDSKYSKEVASNILDNCQTWIYLKTANIETANMIMKKLGNYTTSSSSESVSFSKMNKTNNDSQSRNLISRALLTEDEIIRIERPYVLIINTGNYPALVKIPDLSKWYFNKLFGLGDMEHNRKVREERQNARPIKPQQEVELWGIWFQYRGY